MIDDERLPGSAESSVNGEQRQDTDGAVAPGGRHAAGTAPDGPDDDKSTRPMLSRGGAPQPRKSLFRR